MGLDMYFEGTFSTRAFTERDPKNYAIDPDFKLLVSRLSHSSEDNLLRV